ncbi:AAA family ATPase [Sulfurimonas sp. SWIR-19]|uniref:ATP-dependent nuclease n=1 Tax=Sulfurimonas sp. SWIR-19 TaxID=2878390 RepID=UPI001CF14AF8|nr:AAA family ATPase [Sulfurimonas sp. SWIR-19]UCN01374.1 AAA family ATPase [Sulfurimonas sp. SWIR-19]
MDTILIKTVRINGFRGLKNIEVNLEPTTVLTGMNNSGKTSFLKALQVVFGNRQFLSHDDFYIEDNDSVSLITIDVLIVPLNEDNSKNFSEDWEILLTTDRIKTTADGDFVPLRVVVKYDEIRNSPTVKQYILEDWVDFGFGDPKRYWYELDNGNENSVRFEEIPFFYMDAQRDILEDIKLKSSYIGKMLSKIEYTPEDIQYIENQIELLNQSAVDKSEILTIVKDALTELNSAMDSTSGGVEITPFTKKIRDLNKGLTINYGEGNDSFLMEYHGMGTRSWSSLLTLKAFIELFNINSSKNDSVFFPIVAIEEPESHLHPNAQKKLYSQINNFIGQKIISTHSPYIASAANLEEVRNFYKNDIVKIGALPIASFETEDIRKINRQVINTKGEIFFSKCLVLGEGETEEQALPIFFEKHFSGSSIEYGIDFIGVGSFGNYLPFIRFAESLNIPWFILSDNDDTGKVKISVLKQLTTSGSTRQESNCIVFVDDEKDFEKQLINDGFQDEIKKVLLSLKTYETPQHESAKRPQDEVEINGLSDEQLYEYLTKEKAKFSPLVADEIINSGKELPSKIIDLFTKVASELNIEVQNG